MYSKMCISCQQTSPKTLVWKQDYDVKLWCHNQRTPNTNDYPMPLNETYPIKIFCVRHCLQVFALVQVFCSIHKKLAVERLNSSPITAACRGGGAKGATAPGIQGRGHPKSEYFRNLLFCQD